VLNGRDALRQTLYAIGQMAVTYTSNQARWNMPQMAAAEYVEITRRSAVLSFRLVLIVEGSERRCHDTGRLY
jgi:hypothetical protein